jgi:hypothetical protein
MASAAWVEACTVTGCKSEKTTIRQAVPGKCRLSAKYSNIERFSTQFLAGKLLAPDALQHLRRLRAEDGVAPLGRRGKENDTVVIDDQCRRLLCQPATLQFVQAGFDDGDADYLPLLLFVAYR